MSESIEPTGEAYKNNPDFHKMSDFLGVNIYDRNDYELAKKMSHIHDWAMEKGHGKTMTDCLVEVRNLQRSLGHNFIGKPLITEMYKYIRLMQDKNKQDTASKDSRIIENQQSDKSVSQQKEPKIESSKEQKKPNTLQQTIADTVKQEVSGMVQKALSDKNLITKSVQEAMK